MICFIERLSPAKIGIAQSVKYSSLLVAWTVIVGNDANRAKCIVYMTGMLWDRAWVRILTHRKLIPFAACWYSYQNDAFSGLIDLTPSAVFT